MAEPSSAALADIRSRFLSELWGRYPSVTEKTLSMREVYIKWKKFAYGNERLKQEPLRVGLRLAQVAAGVGVGLSEETPVELRWAAHIELGGFKIHEVLRPGDLVLVQTHWASVVPAPESHRIEVLHVEKIELLCPSNQTGRDHFASPSFSIEDSRSWAQLLHLIRDVFRILDFVEVRTPTLVVSPGIEPHLDAFQTVFQCGGRSQPFFLPTSPEYHLKKMLSHGWLKIFEFKESFRNGELSERHQPEFLMLEWYRAFADLEQIERDLQGMLNYFLLHWPFHQFGLENPKSIKIERQSMSELFFTKTGFVLKADTSLEELNQLARQLGIEVTADDTWDDVFFRIFVARIERDLGMKQPLLVYDYPPSQAALARINGRGWADRFELYYRGFEIANAYHELNDPAIQRERFQKDLSLRRALGKELPPIDEELLSGMEYGMPPSSGIALGVERLFLALTGRSRLDQARVFSLRL